MALSSNHEELIVLIEMEIVKHHLQKGENQITLLDNGLNAKSSEKEE